MRKFLHCSIYILVIILCTFQVTWSLSSFRKLRLIRGKNVLNELRSSSSTCYDTSLIETLRGGFSDVEDDSDEEDSEEESDEEEIDDEEDDEDSEVEEVEKSVVSDAEDDDYDEMLVASPSSQMITIFGVIMLSKKFDLNDPTVVRVARFAFIAYVVVLQLFLLYIRMQAKARNDRTPIKITNPLSKMLTSTIEKKDNLGQVKDIASSLLSSQSTCLEYDLQQIKTMNGGVIANMAMMWFLHFKMNQVQPLILTTVQGFQNLYYSPLFQAYIMGRNLKRPFSNPAMSNLMEKAEATSASSDKLEEADADNTEDESEEEEEEEEEISDDESEEEEEEEEEEESEMEEKEIEQEEEESDAEDDEASEEEKDETDDNDDSDEED